MPELTIADADVQTAAVAAVFDVADEYGGQTVSNDVTAMAWLRALARRGGTQLDVDGLVEDGTLPTWCAAVWPQVELVPRKLAGERPSLVVVDEVQPPAAGVPTWALGQFPDADPDAVVIDELGLIGGAMLSPAEPDEERVDEVDTPIAYPEDDVEGPLPTFLEPAGPTFEQLILGQTASVPVELEPMVDHAEADEPFVDQPAPRTLDSLRVAPEQ